MPGLFFWHGCLHNQALTDAWSTGAGIKGLYRIYVYALQCYLSTWPPLEVGHFHTFNMLLWPHNVILAHQEEYTVQTFISCTSRPDSCQCMYKHPCITCWQNTSNTFMDHQACELKSRSVVRSSIYPCPGNWVAIKHADVYYARAAHTSSEGIKCQHCTIQSNNCVINEYKSWTFSFLPRNNIFFLLINYWEYLHRLTTCACWFLFLGKVITILW